VKLLRFAPALAVLAPLAAHAADVAYCQSYAQATIAQVAVGRAKPACAAGMVGPRWSGAFRVHFEYCMSHEASAVENLRGVRADYLRSCGAAP
jgi:hypothetical protein